MPISLSVKFDDLGIPVLSRSGIETWADEIVGAVAPGCLRHPQSFPIGRFCRMLEEKRRVRFVLDQSLGTRGGYRILGDCNPQRRVIRIDRALASHPGPFNFTLAHEIGHFVLHRRVKKSVILDDDAGFVDTRSTLTLDRIIGAQPRSLVEWQANSFAAALLMPKAQFQEGLKSVQRSMMINRNLGQIWMSANQGSQLD